MVPAPGWSHSGGSDLKGLAGLVRPNDASKSGKRWFKSQNFSDAVFAARFEILWGTANP